MTGIAGIACQGKQDTVEQMLFRIAHRGDLGPQVHRGKSSTIGWVQAYSDQRSTGTSLHPFVVSDTYSKDAFDTASLVNERGPFAIAAGMDEGLFLARDVFGVRPLYYAYANDGGLCFASEVKALLGSAGNITEFPPGHWYTPPSGFCSFATIESCDALQEPEAQITAELLNRLEQSVAYRVNADTLGSWLSGGLDSSVVVALARPLVNTLHTFAGGLPGAPDLEFARQVAAALHCVHHEVILTEVDLLQALPQVIYHLESFDALLVRSTLVNYLVAREAADWVGAVFSGEGADELFAGYAYLDNIPDEQIPGELLDLTRQLHNTALQRVDRSAKAFGLIPHVPFLDPEVAFYVMQIPLELKRGPQNQRVEKWVLRKALEGRLPEAVLWRKKAKFWEGAGVGDLLSQAAEASISERDFSAERQLPNGWLLNTKEELMYYRYFKDHFGEIEDLSWMGRTKGAPQQTPADDASLEGL